VFVSSSEDITKLSYFMVLYDFAIYSDVFVFRCTMTSEEP
jgi:hypothetical protein